MSVIARRRTVMHNLRNTAMQFFKVLITHSLFYNYLFHAQLIRVHADKRYFFLSEYMCFFIIRCVESTRTTHSLFYNYLFHAQLIRVHADKRYFFLSEYMCFFIIRCVESTRTHHSCTLFFFADVSHVLVMF